MHGDGLPIAAYITVSPWWIDEQFCSVLETDPASDNDNRGSDRRSCHLAYFRTNLTVNHASPHATPSRCHKQCERLDSPYLNVLRTFILAKYY